MMAYKHHRTRHLLGRWVILSRARPYAFKRTLPCQESCETSRYHAQLAVQLGLTNACVEALLEVLCAGTPGRESRGAQVKDANWGEVGGEEVVAILTAPWPLLQADK